MIIVSVSDSETLYFITIIILINSIEKPCAFSDYEPMHPNAFLFLLLLFTQMSMSAYSIKETVLKSASIPLEVFTAYS